MTFPRPGKRKTEFHDFTRFSTTVRTLYKIIQPQHFILQTNTITVVATQANTNIAFNFTMVERKIFISNKIILQDFMLLEIKYLGPFSLTLNLGLADI